MSCNSAAVEEVVRTLLTVGNARDAACESRGRRTDVGTLRTCKVTRPLPPMPEDLFTPVKPLTEWSGA